MTTRCGAISVSTGQAEIPPTRRSAAEISDRLGLLSRSLAVKCKIYRGITAHLFTVRLLDDAHPRSESRRDRTLHNLAVDSECDGAFIASRLTRSSRLARRHCARTRAGP